MQSQSSSGCGVAFSAISSTIIPANEFYPEETQTDTIETCLTWTGSDYTAAFSTIGASQRESFESPLGSVAYSYGTVSGVSTGGNTNLATGANSMLDFIEAPTQIRSAVASNPYYFIVSCPGGGTGGGDDGGGLPEDPELPEVDPGDTGGGGEDPCGGTSGMHMGDKVAMDARVASRTPVVEHLVQGLKAEMRRHTGGLHVYRGKLPDGSTRTVKVHPRAKVVVTEETSGAGRFERTDHVWKRAGSGYIRTGVVTSIEDQVGGKQIRLTSSVVFRGIRFNSR